MARAWAGFDKGVRMGVEAEQEQAAQSQADVCTPGSMAGIQAGSGVGGGCQPCELPGAKLQREGQGTS